MSFVSKLLSKVDGYEQHVRLTIGKDDSVATGLGGFFTIAALAATISLAAATLSNYLYHMSPQIQFQYDYFPDPGGLDLNSSNFLFSITNQDADYFLDSAMVSFNMIYVVQTRLPNGTYLREKHPIPLVKCTREYWKGFEADYDMQNMGNRLCPSIDQYNITGTFLSWEYVYIQLEVQKCKNRTDQPDIICKPKEELDAILPGKDIAVSFMYTDNIFNLNDWENPVKRFVTSMHWNIAPGVLSKKTDVFISQYDIITDDNYLLEGYWESNHSTYQVNAQERNQNYAPEPSDVYMKIYLRKSSTFTTATRQFLKAGQVMEALGGLAGFWFALFGAIAIFYNRKVFELRMANALYEFDKNYDKKPPKKTEGNETKKKGFYKYFSRCKNCFQKCFRRVTRSRKTNYSTNSAANPAADQLASPRVLDPGHGIPDGEKQVQASDRVKLYLKSFQNYSQKLGKKMSYSHWDFLIGVFLCGRRKKDKLISIASEKVQEDTDIIQILKRLQELEKLKDIFFNDHQKRVFAYSRPPLISLEESEMLNQAKPPPKPNQDKPNKQRQSFFRNSIQKLRRKNLLQKDPMEDIDNISKFALIFDSYRKIRRIKNSRINKELIKLLDSEMEEALYNLDFELKVDKTFSNEYFKIMAIRVFEDLFFRAKRKKKKLSKEDAANIIARRWLLATKKRKARDVRKVTRMITMSRRTMILPHQHQPTPDLESADVSKKEELGSVDREDDILNEYERGGGDDFGSNDEDYTVRKDPHDFEDDEILNDLYNYGEEIGDLQTPIVSKRVSNNVRALESPTNFRSNEDSRIDMGSVGTMRDFTAAHSKFKRSHEESGVEIASANVSMRDYMIAPNKGTLKKSNFE